MDVPTGLAVLGLAVSLFLATLIAASLAATTATSRSRLRALADDGIAAARRLLPLMEQPASAAAALAAANALAVLLVFGFALAVARAPQALEAAEMGILGLAAVLLLFGQATAWAAALARPEGVALGLSRLIVLLVAILRPPVGLLADRIARRVWPGRPARVDNGASELQKLVEAVEENATLEAGEQKMIHGIVELGERTTREVMVPRIDVVAASQETPVREVIARMRATGHSRIPLYAESIDDIVGILYAKDLLHRLPDLSLDVPVGPLAREAQFVPETKRVDDLLHEMQERKVHIAVVVDEYGGTAGIITIEDLLEEIVGEIRDEYDTGEEVWIEQAGEGEAVFDARVSIHDVNQTLDLDLDDAEYDTLGGLVYAHLGKVPAQGDEVRMDNVAVTVLSTAGRRIRKVHVSVQRPAANGASGPL